MPIRLVFAVQRDSSTYTEKSVSGRSRDSNFLPIGPEEGMEMEWRGGAECHRGADVVVAAGHWEGGRTLQDWWGMGSGRRIWRVQDMFWDRDLLTAP